MTQEVDDAAASVIDLVHRTTLSLSTEKATQADLHAALVMAGIGAEREVRLAPGDIIDLLLPCGLGIEVKLRGAQKRRVFAQLVRYAGHERIRGLLLVTNLPMGLPPVIQGKPAWSASLGRGWL